METSQGSQTGSASKMEQRKKNTGKKKERNCQDKSYSDSLIRGT